MNLSTDYNTRCISIVCNEESLGRPEKRARLAHSLDSVAVLNAQAISDFAIGKFNDAESHFSQALKTTETSSNEKKVLPRTLFALEPSTSQEDVVNCPSNDATSSPQAPSHVYEYEYDEGLRIFDEPLPINPLASPSSIRSTLCYNIGQTHKHRKNNQEALLWFREALESVIGVRDSYTLMILHNLDYANYRSGDKDESLRMYEEALELVSQLDNCDVRVAAITMNCVAVLTFHHAFGKDGSRALELFLQSLVFLKSCEKRSNRDIATLLNNIGRVYFARFEMSLAKKFYSEALKMRLQVLGTDSMDVAASYYNAGQTLQQLGELDAALDYYMRFLRFADSKIGFNGRELSMVYKCMAEIYHTQTKLQDAYDTYLKALDSLQSSLGETHIEVAAVLNKIGNLCYEMRRYSEALKFYCKGLDIEKEHLAPNHVHLMITLTNIAHVHKHLGEHVKALHVYRHVYLVQLDNLGRDSLQLASTLSSIGLVQYHLGDYEEALDSYQEALRIRRAHSNKDKANMLEIASTLNSLGLVFFKQEMFRISQECFFEALEIRHEFLGRNSHDVAVLWYNIATIFFETGEDDKAVEYYKEALRVERTALGDGHPDVVLTLRHLGQVVQQLGRLDEATNYFKEALAIESQSKRDDYKFQAKLWNQLGNVYLAAGDVGMMMETYVHASRLYKQYNEGEFDIVVAGYNYYGLVRLHPPCAPTA